MNPILDISADTSNFKDHFDLLSCFLQAASTLYGSACDGIVRNHNGNIGFGTNEVWNHNLIAAFYLLRHALELAIKALIKISTNKDVFGHDIKKLCEENIPNYHKIPNLDTALLVLAKYHILEEAQLFRYPIDKSGVKLEDLQTIKNEDFDALSGAAWSVRQAFLECMHVKKGLA